jgi:hypothetical protein
METGNVDVVLMQITANECNAATEDSRGISTPGSRPLSRQARRPDAAGTTPRRIVANVFAGPRGTSRRIYQ